MFRLSTLITIVLVLTACNGGAAAPEPSATPVPPTQTHRSIETATVAGPTPTPPALVEPLRSDLALRLQVDESEVEVAEFEKTVWPDASLGCPDPERMYAQVTTPGYLVRLQVRDEVFEYHTAAGGPFVLCQGGRPELPKIPVAPGEIQDGEPWMPAGSVPTKTP